MLHVDRNLLTDDGLRHLAHTSTLESLALSSIDGIRGPGLQHLAGLSALKELDLQYVPLDCNWLQEIIDLPLEKLMLSKTSLEDTHLDHVGRITTLVILSIDRTHVTGAGLAKLTNLGTLQQLYLNEAAALDGVEYLRQLPSLNYLGIETKNPDDPSGSVLKRLRQALPGCQVNTL